MTRFYRAYFERLAILHKKLLHSPAEPAYFYVQDKYNPTAFDNAIRSAAKTTVLLLERYSLDFTDNNNKNFYRPISGRFTVVANSQVGDQDSIQDAEQLCEDIALSILRRMSRDFGDGGGFIDLGSGDRQRVLFNLESIPVDPVGPMNLKYYGVTVGFKWRCPFTGADQAGDWLDDN